MVVAQEGESIKNGPTAHKVVGRSEGWGKAAAEEGAQETRVRHSVCSREAGVPRGYLCVGTSELTGSQPLDLSVHLVQRHS